jgi:hypothetical protein
MAQKKTKLLAHKVLGKMLQELLTPLGVTVETEFSIMSESPKGDILLLRQERAEWTPEQRALLPDGIRDSQASHILLELKHTESANEAALRQALGYDIFYRRTQQLAEADIQTFLLSAKTPLPATLQGFGYKLSEEPGVYYSDNVLLRRLPVLLLNELRDAPHNAFVKTLASRQQAKRAAFATLRAVGLATFPGGIQWLLRGLWRQWNMSTEEMELEEVELGPDELIELGKEWQEILLSSLPAAELLKYVTPEERLAGLEPEERLAGLEPEERLAGLEPEEIEAYLRKLKGAR